MPERDSSENQQYQQNMEPMFVYLVQGYADHVAKYLFLADRPSAHAFFLTFDKPLDGCIYFHGCSWAQGRNRLLAEARKSGDFLYFIFLDDDIVFAHGDYDLWEARLLELRPAVAVPVTSRCKRSVIGIGDAYGGLYYPLLKWQVIKNNDEQMIAFHHDVVADEIILPLLTDWDDSDWHSICTVQQSLIYNLYSGKCLQFNEIIVHNTQSRKYPATAELTEGRKWLENNLRSSYSDRQSRLRLILDWSLLRYILTPITPNHLRRLRDAIVGYREVLRLTKMYRPSASYRLSPERITSIFREDSSFFIAWKSKEKTANMSQI